LKVFFSFEIVLESFTSTPSPPLLMVHGGDSFILNCSLPNSLPDATVWWLRNSIDVLTLPDASNRFTVFSSATTSSLIASYSVNTDGGRYGCQISNHLVNGMTLSYESADVSIGELHTLLTNSVTHIYANETGVGVSCVNVLSVALLFTESGGDPALIQRFVFQPLNVEVVAGQSAKLQCFVVGQ